MPLPSDQVNSFLKLLDALSTLKNRNSRFIGPQFVHLPDPAQNAELYRQIKTPRSLDMIKTALNNNAYDNISQVYYDFVTVFRNIQDTANRSSVQWRDATKMEQLLEELWKEDPKLPPMATVDTSVRPVQGNAGDEGDSAEAAMQARARARMAGPKIVPAHHVVTDHIHPQVAHLLRSGGTPSASSPGAGNPGSFQRQASYPGMAPSHMTGPATTGMPVSSSTMQMSTFAPSTPLGYQTAHSMQQPSSLPIFVPVPLLTATGELNTEQQIFVPPSVFSKEAKSRLQQEQAKMFANRANALSTTKKRKRSDEVADSSTGWLERRPTNSEQKHFYLEILARIRSEKDSSGSRNLSGPINALPSPEKVPQFYQHIKDPHPPTLNSIEKHIRTNLPPSTSDFDAEMATVLANARLWLSAGLNSSDGEALPNFYGDILSLQRIYNEITRGTGSMPPAGVAAQSLASIPAGPGSVPTETYETQDGSTRVKVIMSSNRIPSAEKAYLSEVNYKGEEFRAGDFVHLYNPSNAKLPIIGQVFKCYKKLSDDRRYITVNWYYRPSQTVHAETRTFYEQEVFKTSLMIDHKVEDIIEKVSVMHISDYTKGRWDYWEEDMPVYVVEHRYNVDSRSFAKIKTWSRCIPEGTLPDPSSMRLFLEFVPPPPRIKSPFIRIAGTNAITGPGQIGEPLEVEEDEQQNYHTPLDEWAEGEGQVIGYAKLTAQKKLADAVPSTKPQAPQKTQKKAKPAPTNALPTEVAATKEFVPSTQAEQLALQESFETLPTDLVSRFRADPRTGELLWFTAPPLDRLESETATVGHSLEYLSRLARAIGF